MPPLIAQIGLPQSDAAARLGRDAINQGISPLVIIGGVALVALMIGAWWHAKHS
jgi:hypothetical protein